MTKITISRAVVEQAAEALELSMKLLPNVLGGKRSNAAIALRAELAEPVREPAPMPPFPPVSLWKRGCAVCGIGAGGHAYGYACPRSDCPTRVTCGGVV